MITETSYIHGPFVLIVTNQQSPEDPSYPMVVEPTDGFPSKEAARKYAEAADASMAKQGEERCFNWYIAQRSSLADFKNFCSF